MGGAQSLKHTATYCDGLPVDKYELVWTIPNVQKLLSSGVGFSTSTSALNLTVKEDTENFKVSLYPNGFNERVNGYVSLWLQKLTTKERLITFTCAIIGADGNQVVKKLTKQKMGVESFIGWMTFCPRNILIEKDFNVLKEDNLTLECSVHIFNEKALANPENEDESCENTVLSDLSNNLMSLLLDEAYHDFTMHVQGKKFSVHKAILGARSPVLKAMLRSKLNNSNSMTITDISEPIVKEMLGFIYSGKVGYLDFQEACELYYAADKYEIDCLKNICCNIIKKNVKVDNVLKALLLSERHSDIELQEICIQYVVENAPQVHELVEWITFLKSQPDLTSIIFRRLAQKKENTKV
ncbi:hypothetical protein JTE90_023483 [Oedothorax gibbosus]|uniref:Uncharacterized protein n=1 Tax=Oedothorax gibbosus TaxID=931172 RepID=A0AAV6VRM2_9ARAC|nr:hypothetical protein JTE90_023483 [Oedothorax gibbosus]